MCEVFGPEAADGLKGSAAGEIACLDSFQKPCLQSGRRAWFVGDYGDLMNFQTTDGVVPVRSGRCRSGPSPFHYLFWSRCYFCYRAA